MTDPLFNRIAFIGIGLIGSSLARAIAEQKLAKELAIPIIALSQLSRAVEQTKPAIPRLAHLRESGSIEQDADVVMFVYRDEYYLARDVHDTESKNYAQKMERLERVKNVAECIVAKQRHGPVGTVVLSFQGEFTKFDNYSGDYKGQEE